MCTRMHLCENEFCLHSNIEIEEEEGEPEVQKRGKLDDRNRSNVIE